MLLFYGLLIHVIFLLSIFDIYFKSPVIKGIKAYYPKGTYPASRLVLFSADGLRAESLFRSKNTEHLKSLIKNKGYWGISHTRVPTESRPGHVAIIAGLYEDPSAVAKGWKENPVEFDSVFNRSYHTWSWGSPDILPMFAKGATGNNVDTYYYSHEEEDFSGKISTSKLDTWVFDKVEAFFKNAKNDPTLLNQLKKDKIIFFLHLLGLDTAGHTHKPHSKEYEENIKVVDNGILKMEQIIEEFYDHDGKTAYVFTADHGMTDWGSHGAGEDHETQTPLIVWGAGIPEPVKKVDINDKPFWDIKENRHDVNQADICPLMATLIGVPIPVNSVGVLPEAYFKTNMELKARGFYNNARQLISQYNRKKEIVEKYAITQIYKPFMGISSSQIQNALNHIDHTLDSGSYEITVKLCKQLIDLIQLGLDYYQNYYQNYLLICMTLSYIGWIWCLLSIILDGYISSQQLNKSPINVQISQLKSRIDIVIHILFGLIYITTLSIIYVQNLPFKYIIYSVLPIVLWWRVFLSWKLWFSFIKSINQTSTFIIYFKLMSILIIYSIGLTILVCAFFHRWTLSICLFGLSIFQFHNSYRKKLPKSVIICWMVTCAGLAAFSFLPVIGKDDNIHLVGVSGLLWFFGSLLFLSLFSLKMLKNGQETKKQNMIMVVPIILMLLTIQNKYFVDYMFSAKKGLPLFNQILSWILTVASIVTPLFSSRFMISRLFSIFSSFSVFFLLLSVSHEGFFLFILACNLICWLMIEHYTNNDNRNTQFTLWTFQQKHRKDLKINTIQRNINSDDFRRSFIFLFYIILSFFGTGNIASINSFDPQWVRCFVSQFSPFLMGGLILCKTLVPFLFVACTFCAVNLVVKAPTGQLFVIVLIFSDFMGLYFLHLVTNKGSWLDIGTSISHYVIMETTVLFVSILYVLGQLLTGTLSFKNILKKDTKLS